MRTVEWELLHGGYCTALEKIAYPKGKFRKRKFPALFSLITHQTHGPILFDTGYSDHFFTETKRFPYRFYRYITPVTLTKNEDAFSQLKRRDILPTDIKYIILSHLHADHIAGCKDFQHTTFICSRIEYEHVKNMTGLHAIKHGFVPGLLPEDFNSRVTWIEDCPRITIKEELSPFSHAYDIFSDSSLLAVHLPGHSPGQYGLFLKTASRHVLLAADSCWLAQSYRENILPHPMANILTTSTADYIHSLASVHQLSKQRPDIHIVPSHCLETWKQDLERNS